MEPLPGSVLTAAGAARIHFRLLPARGEAPGTKILLIPGYSGGEDCWGQPFLEELRRQSLSPVIYDPRGIGLSTLGNLPGSVELWAADAAALIQRLGGPMALLGWSLGATVALETALTCPHLVSALILCCGSADTPRLAAPSGPLAPLLEAPGGAGRAALLAKALTPETAPHRAELEKALKARLIQAEEHRAAALAQQRRGLARSPRHWPRLKDLACPLLAWGGRQDTIVPPEESRILAEAAPGGQWEILPGGHGMICQNGPQLARKAAAFLKS